MATITSDVNEGLNDFAVLAEVQQTLVPFAADELPPGYTMNYAGQNQDQQEAQEFLLGAFMTAVMVIALILVSQFNSGDQAVHYHDVCAAVDHGGAVGPDDLPHALRGHHDRYWDHLAGGHRGEQLDRHDRLYRHAAESATT